MDKIALGLKESGSLARAVDIAADVLVGAFIIGLVIYGGDIGGK